MFIPWARKADASDDVAARGFAVRGVFSIAFQVIPITKRSIVIEATRAT